LIVKLKLPPTPEQFRALRRTQLADRDALNFVSRFAFAHGKQSSTIALQEKTRLGGSLTVRVDAYTFSQALPRCGHTAEGNRPDKGLLFICQVCHLVPHADLIEARNIVLRTMLARQDWVSRGLLPERPDVSDAEAKAARRHRYAEWRWSPDRSPDTSLAPEGRGI
jgi:hypothetical protein